MSKRLVILKQSLERKEKAFDAKMNDHFESVKQANGQPLNDKRNGSATLNKWDRQNNALRKLQDGIKATKQAIEKEQSKIANVSSVVLPEPIQKLLDSGELVQWRKYPNRFFVNGVQKARIVWNEDTKKVGCLYVSAISQEKFPKFRDVFNSLCAALNK